jgi:hypothetical protein
MLERANLREAKALHKAGRYIRCSPTSSWTIWTRNWKSANITSTATPMTATFMQATVELAN